MKDAVFFGSTDIQKDNKVCGMRFEEANEDDIAEWTCEVQQCDTTCKTENGEGETASALIHVEVTYCCLLVIHFPFIYLLPS